LGGRGRRISEFEAILVYKVSSRTARAIQRNPVSKNKTNKTNKQTNKHLRAEIKQLETKKTIESINKTKNWVFEKINKIDKLLAK
jgi:cell division protein FtsB